MSYLRNAPGRRATPQSEALEGQIPNRAGGHAYPVDPLAQLRRWLILGSEGATYYASEKEVTYENVRVLGQVDPVEAIDLIRDISHDGLAPKNDPAIFALAYFAAHKDEKVRQYALGQLSAVCRIGTHLFHFAEYVQKQRGWGRSLRRAVGQWYVTKDVEQLAVDIAEDIERDAAEAPEGKTVDQLAYQLVKYRQRDAWTHRDLLRLSHPAATVSSGNPTVFDTITPRQAALFDWVCGRKADKQLLPKVVRGYRWLMKKERTPEEVAVAIRKYNLPREAVPNQYLTHPQVWNALTFETNDKVVMPMTALIRNLPTLTRVGVLKPMSAETSRVCEHLVNGEVLKKARIHPLNLLVAQLTYACGRSLRGSSQWEPVREVVDALDEAFYASFGFVEPSGKRTLLAIDVSGSMGWGTINGVPGLTPRIAAGCMAMAQARVGDPYVVVAFTGNSGYYAGNTTIQEVPVSPRQRLDDVARTFAQIPYGATDCALPMLYAMQKGLEVDAFLTYTDNESWAGKIHPSQALEQYRQKTGIRSRFVASAFTATNYSVADPNDPLSMNVVGLDSSAPQLITDFAAGRI